MEYTAAQARRDSDNYLLDVDSSEQLEETLNLIKDAALWGRENATTYPRLNSAVCSRLAKDGYNVVNIGTTTKIYW